MDEKVVRNLLEEILEEETDTLDGSEMLEDIGWDSLSFMSFLTILDERHSLKIPPNEIAACQSVEQLVQLLIAK